MFANGHNGVVPVRHENRHRRLPLGVHANALHAPLKLMNQIRRIRIPVQRLSDADDRLVNTRDAVRVDHEHRNAVLLQLTCREQPIHVPDAQYEIRMQRNDLLQRWVQRGANLGFARCLDRVGGVFRNGNHIRSSA